MSAFLQSGRSETPKSKNSKVRFRPGAAIQNDRKRAPLPRQGPQTMATKAQRVLFLTLKCAQYSPLGYSGRHGHSADPADN